MTATDLSGVRASSCVGCQRKGFYEGIGVEREEFTRTVLRLFRIRTMQSDAVMAEKAEEARALGRKIVLEQEILWGPRTTNLPEGIYSGHADYADWTDYEVIEATGSADLTPERRKILQAAFYAKRLSELTGKAWKAFVLVFDPSTGNERYVPVNWRALAFELDDIFATVLGAIETGDVPERVCQTPHDGPAHYCAFAGHCFAGWEYPPIGEITDEALAAQVREAYELAKRADTKLIEKDLKPLKKKVATHLAPKAKYRVPIEGGEIEVRRTDVKGSRSISLTEVEAAGFELPDELLPFVKQGEGFTKLETKLIEGAR